MTGSLHSISGSAWLLGDHVNTDMLHPPAYFSLDAATVQKGLSEGMRRLDSAAMEKAPDLIIVAGRNFGCGSSRETSVRALRDGGVRAVVARSFARIFYRSLVNAGIPALVYPASTGLPGEGERVTVDLDKCVLSGCGFEALPLEPPDPHVQRILDAGGLVALLEMELQR